jgi:hypothetical protein
MGAADVSCHFQHRNIAQKVDCDVKRRHSSYGHGARMRSSRSQPTKRFCQALKGRTTDCRVEDSAAWVTPEAEACWSADSITDEIRSKEKRVGAIWIEITCI